MAIPKRKNVDSVAPHIYDETNDVYSPISESTPLPTEEVVVVDTPEYFEDTSFVTGDSPVTLDLNTALGRNATSVLIINDGAGNFTYQLSTDGVTFGDSITMKSGEFKEYEGISVDSIKITWVSNSAYRVEAI